MYSHENFRYGPFRGSQERFNEHEGTAVSPLLQI